MIYEFSKHPSSIKSDFEGYLKFVDLYHEAGELFFDDLIIDFANVKFFDANLSAVLGSILSELSKTNSISIINLKPEVEKILRKNLFLSNFGKEKAIDYYESTIKYRKFKTSEEKLFKQYLDLELLSKKAMPKMSSPLRKKINESIFEIFNNAVIHGQCETIFSCGQYFHKNAELDFTIVDLGVSIKEIVNRHLNENLPASETIEWAVREGNTTKTGPIPGGLGLKLIREFLKKNGGRIQILSANGFWEESRTGISAHSFINPFPGTIVNLQFNINDTTRYYLSTEIDTNNIF